MVLELVKAHKPEILAELAALDAAARLAALESRRAHVVQQLKAAPACR
jgi:hypothetical protein